MRTAVIIAGGRGERLRPLTNNMPKTLMMVAGKPILYWELRWLKNQGIKHVVIGVAWKKEKIYKYVNDNRNFGLDVDFSEHTVEGGTAQGIDLAVKRFVNDDNYLVMNGDNITNINITRMLTVHRSKKALLTMGLAPLYSKVSIVDINNGFITKLRYSGLMEGLYYTNGVYIFNRKLERHFVSRGAIEQLVFSKLAKRGKVASYILSKEEHWRSFNTIEELRKIEDEKKAWIKDFE